MAQPATACPDEDVFVPPVPGAVNDAERLIRFISLRTQLLPKAEGWRVSPTEFSKADINGKLEDGQRRSVSTFRFDLMTKILLLEQALEVNREADWDQNPVIALAITSSVRAIVDRDGRREMCVYADWSEGGERVVAYPLHASIRKSDPVKPGVQRQDILILKSALSDVSSEIRHLIDGLPVVSSQLI